jgi:hypothetical protein
MAKTVKLTVGMLEFARKVGFRRQSFHEGRGTKDAYGFEGDGAKIHVDGAIGEQAVAFFLGEKWVPFSEDFKELGGDVGRDRQVRATRHERGGLVLHQEDADEKPFILATLENLPWVTLVGWLWGSEGKLLKYWEDGSRLKAFKSRTCYLVPQRYLRWMESLPR